MENQKLPNASAVLILGILANLTCCCWGVGIVLGIIAMVLAKKDLALYNQDPKSYQKQGFNNINTGRILAIVGIILSTIYLIFAIYINTAYTEQELIDMQQNLLEKINHQKEIDS